MFIGIDQLISRLISYSSTEIHKLNKTLFYQCMQQNSIFWFYGPANIILCTSTKLKNSFHWLKKYTSKSLKLVWYLKMYKFFVYCGIDEFHNKLKLLTLAWVSFTCSPNIIYLFNVFFQIAQWFHDKIFFCRNVFFYN